MLENINSDSWKVLVNLVSKTSSLGITITGSYFLNNFRIVLKVIYAAGWL